MTSARTANIAILGCGRQGYVHAKTIVAVGAPARLAAVFDAFPAAATALASSHPHQPKVAGSVDEILSDEAIDAVIVVTPNATHAALVLQVAKAGKACLCEKPLDKDLDAINVLRAELAQLEKTQPLPFIAVGFPKRHDPTFTSMSVAIKDKTVGELEQLIIWSRDTAPQPTAYMAASGGMITDSAIHDLDLARALCGPDDYPVSVSVQGSTLISPEACAESGDVTRTNITLATKQGRLVSLFNARRCVAGHDQRVEAHCSLGDLKADNPHANDNYLVVSTAASGTATQPWWTTTADRYAAAMLRQTRELVAACVGGRGPLPPGQQVGATITDGWWANRTAEAAKLSLKEGRVVFLDADA